MNTPKTFNRIWERGVIIEPLKKSHKNKEKTYWRTKISLYWFKHNCKDGQYSSAQVHRSVKVRLKDSCTIPRSVHDYDISVDELYGLDYEDVKGVC